MYVARSSSPKYVLVCASVNTSISYSVNVCASSSMFLTISILRMLKFLTETGAGATAGSSLTITSLIEVSSMSTSLNTISSATLMYSGIPTVYSGTGCVAISMYGAISILLMLKSLTETGTLNLSSSILRTTSLTEVSIISTSLNTISNDASTYNSMSTSRPCVSILLVNRVTGVSNPVKSKSVFEDRLEIKSSAKNEIGVSPY